MLAEISPLQMTMLDDQTLTERQQVVKQTGTCLQCHASLYVLYRKAGNGDLIKGFEKSIDFSRKGQNTLRYDKNDARAQSAKPGSVIERLRFRGRRIR